MRALTFSRYEFAAIVQTLWSIDREITASGDRLPNVLKSNARRADLGPGVPTKVTHKSRLIAASLMHFGKVVLRSRPELASLARW